MQPNQTPDWIWECSETMTARTYGFKWLSFFLLLWCESDANGVYQTVFRKGDETIEVLTASKTPNTAHIASMLMPTTTYAVQFLH
jgi:hypothetical protein